MRWARPPWRPRRTAVCSSAVSAAAAMMGRPLTWVRRTCWRGRGCKWCGSTAAFDSQHGTRLGGECDSHQSGGGWLRHLLPRRCPQHECAGGGNDELSVPCGVRLQPALLRGAESGGRDLQNPDAICERLHRGCVGVFCAIELRSGHLWLAGHSQPRAAHAAKTEAFFFKSVLTAGHRDKVRCLPEAGNGSTPLECSHFVGDGQHQLEPGAEAELNQPRVKRRRWSE